MKCRSWSLLLGVLDALFIGITAVMGLSLYYSGRIPELYVATVLPRLVPLTVVLVIVANIAFGLYRRDWRHVGLEAAISIGLSITAAILAAALLGHYLGVTLPLIVWLVIWMASIFASLGYRFLWRLALPRVEALSQWHQGDAGRRVPRTNILIYGAGSLGSSVARMIEQQVNPNYSVVGFIDDDRTKQQLYVGGYRVLGTGADLQKLVQRYGIEEVIVAFSDLGRRQRQEIIATCGKVNAKATVIPSLPELLEEKRTPVREIGVEDILGRVCPTVNGSEREYLAGKTVLITGAGGSIGSELSRQICAQNPAHVILLGRGENRIHWIYLQLCKRYAHVRLTPVIQNITTRSGMARLFEAYQPDIVFHAAAHKHVYLMESEPVEAVRNNVLATDYLAQLAEQHGVERFVFISTDKAVAPASVMGATKRACELLLISRPQSRTRFICVRFGNVLGSEGSVLEIFRRQWRNGEPLTVTHPEATRYFMSIPEASFLVLEAGALGEHGDTLLLDMGEPVKISKLASDFILLHGGNPYAPSAIQFIGLREGERLHETLAHQHETLCPTANPLISKIDDGGQCLEHGAVREYLRALTRTVEAEDQKATATLLSELTDANLTVDQALRLHRSAV